MQSSKKDRPVLRRTIISSCIGFNKEICPVIIKLTFSIIVAQEVAVVVVGERVGIRERISKLIAHLSASDHLAFYCDLASSSSSCSLPLFYYIGPSMPNLQLGGCNSSTATTRDIMYMEGERKGTGETTRRSFDFDFVTNQY